MADTDGRDVVDVLLAARDRIADGWCKHSLWNQEGAVCAIGGILEALNPGMRMIPEAAALRLHQYMAPVARLLRERGETVTDAESLPEWLRSQPDLDWMLIAEWNNQPLTSKLDVIDLFNDAAAELKAEGSAG